MAIDTESRFAQLEIDDIIPAPKAPVAAPAAPQGPPPATLADIAAMRGPVIPTRAQALAQQRAAMTAPIVQAPARVQAKDLVAVADEASSTGTMTYWSLPGSVDIEKLRASWTAEGLNTDHLPKVPSPSVALHRACKEQTTAQRFLDKHPLGGWVLVDRRRAGDTLAYEVGTRIRLGATSPSGDSEQILVTPPGGKDATPEANAEAREIGARVRTEFNRLRSEIASVDVSVWLVHMVSGLKGVALRDSGGFYFIPKERTEELAKVARALKAASAHTVYEIPVMQGSKTVAAILDALRREVTETITSLEGELNDADGIGSRAARSRANEVVELNKKVRGYAKLLGINLDEVTAKLDTLRTKLEASTTRFSSLEVG